MNTTAWTSASDGTLEDRVYYCQNWRADVSAIVSALGGMLEWAKYSAYGVPFGLPGGDADSDGDCDSTDVVQIQAWITAYTVDIRGDLNLDGHVDSADEVAVLAAPYSGATAGPRILGCLTACRRGMGGADMMGGSRLLWAMRNRVLSASVGCWLSRDPLGYNDSMNMYIYCVDNPQTALDPTGEAVFVQIPPDDLRPYPRPARRVWLTPGKLCRIACAAAGTLCALGCPTTGPVVTVCFVGCALFAAACVEACPP